MFTAPSVDGRSKREDLKRVSRLRIYEWQAGCCGAGRFERAHNVSKALGVTYSMTANVLEALETPEEHEAVTRWESYCDALYEAIPEYLLELVK